MTDTNENQPAARRSRRMAREPKAGAAGESSFPAPVAGEEQSAPGRAPTKALIVEGLLRRTEGASLDDLCQATGWLPHTCRAFLTGLRKKGREVGRDKRPDGTTIYRLAVVQVAA